MNYENFVCSQGKSNLIKYNIISEIRIILRVTAYIFYIFNLKFKFFVILHLFAIFRIICDLCEWMKKIFYLANL